MKHILKTTVLIILFLNFSCSSNDDSNKIIEEISTNKINFKINGLVPANSIRGLSASYCCENEISVSFEHWVANSDGLGSGGSAFNLLLDKSGNLIGLWYKDYTHPNNVFESPYFVPISTLNIENFQFIENQVLKLKFSGKIFKRTYEFSTAPESVNIEADIEIKEFTNCICDSNFSKITTANGFNFHDVTKRQQENEISYFANTNDGYQLEFLNFEESIQNMPLGIYEFDENTTSQRIDFRKFIGIPRAFSLNIIPQEWLKYETSGSFEIFERQKLNNGKIITKVKFNLIAKNNNEVVFEFENAILED